MQVSSLMIAQVSARVRVTHRVAGLFTENPAPTHPAFTYRKVFGTRAVTMLLQGQRVRARVPKTKRISSSLEPLGMVNSISPVRQSAFDGGGSPPEGRRV